MNLTERMIVHFCEEHLASLRDTIDILQAFEDDNLSAVEILAQAIRKKGEDEMARLGEPCEMVPDDEDPVFFEEEPPPNWGDVDHGGEIDEYPDDPWA